MDLDNDTAAFCFEDRCFGILEKGDDELDFRCVNFPLRLWMDPEESVVVLGDLVGSWLLVGDIPIGEGIEGGDSINWYLGNNLGVGVSR